MKHFHPRELKKSSKLKKGHAHDDNRRDAKVKNHEKFSKGKGQTKLFIIDTLGTCTPLLPRPCPGVFLASTQSIFPVP